MLYLLCVVLVHEFLRLGMLWWVSCSPSHLLCNASSGEDSLCSMQTMDVIRAGLDTHQDNLVTIFASSHGFISWENNLGRDLQNFLVQQRGIQRKKYHMSDTSSMEKTWNAVNKMWNRLPFVQIIGKLYMSSFTVYQYHSNINQSAKQMGTARPSRTAGEQWMNNGWGMHS